MESLTVDVQRADAARKRVRGANSLAIRDLVLLVQVRALDIGRLVDEPVGKIREVPAALMRYLSLFIMLIRIGVLALTQVPDLQVVWREGSLAHLRAGYVRRLLDPDPEPTRLDVLGDFAGVYLVLLAFEYESGVAVGEVDAEDVQQLGQGVDDFGLLACLLL